MSVYKVPQDVEADDKLLGPFSFRQFIYLGVVAMSIGIAYGLGKLLLPLFIIPLPITILFGALALPLRKDQPMETYLAAIVSFYLKPRRRLWDPDGVDSLIEIIAPKTVEVQLTKDLSQGEAQQRFGYLAQIVDSQGWAIRGTGTQTANNSMISDEYYSAQQVEDVMDENNSTVRSLDQKLGNSDARRHQEAMNIMSNIINTPTIPSNQVAAPIPPVGYFNGASPVEPNAASDQNLSSNIDFNPYPEDMRQTVIAPIEAEAPKPKIEQVFSPAKPKPSTSEKPLPAGIINLANNTSLSIDTSAREANRINKKQDLNEEVFVSLR